jgi:hypothetical protein
MEGSGSGSIPLTSGSGSGFERPKNMWIRWIRIRNTASNMDSTIFHTVVYVLPYRVHIRVYRPESMQITYITEHIVKIAGYIFFLHTRHYTCECLSLLISQHFFLLLSRNFMLRGRLAA